MSDSREQLVAALPELLALLAHDLKNPLAAVLANLSFLQSSLSHDADMHDAIVDARLASEVLQRLVGNLELIGRELGDATAGRRMVDFPLRALADEVCGHEREQAEGRHLFLVVHEPPGLRISARADRDRALRALGNLVSNAVQHAPAGSEITIECARLDGACEIVVADDGPIVPAALREVVVSAAGQGSSKSRSDGRYGRGLALMVAAVAARHAGGAFAIEQRGGRSALVLRLPLAEEG